MISDGMPNSHLPPSRKSCFPPTVNPRPQVIASGGGDSRVMFPESAFLDVDIFPDGGSWILGLGS
jgi:hypothetical protein